MEWITWLVEQLKWVVLEFPKPENLGKLANQIGAVWIYLLLFVIIFSETGLLVGFFLPGDSLLFAAGFLSSQYPTFPLQFLLLNALLMVAAIAGDALNYALGWKMGSRVYTQGNLWFIKQDHLLAAKAFYEKHGGKAIVLARFVPLVRTFTPFVAGVARMPYGQFVWFNVLGGIGWVFSMTLAGYLLGQNEWVSKNFEKVVILIIAISVLPVAIGAFRHWRAKRIETPESHQGTEEAEAFRENAKVGKE